MTMTMTMTMKNIYSDINNTLYNTDKRHIKLIRIKVIMSRRSY